MARVSPQRRFDTRMIGGVRNVIRPVPTLTYEVEGGGAGRSARKLYLLAGEVDAGIYDGLGGGSHETWPMVCQCQECARPQEDSRA